MRKTIKNIALTALSIGLLIAVTNLSADYGMALMSIAAIYTITVVAIILGAVLALSIATIIDRSSDTDSTLSAWW